MWRAFSAGAQWFMRLGLRSRLLKAVALRDAYGYAWALVKPQIMYIELKTDGLSGEGRIGRVEFSQTGKTLYYAGRTFAPLKGHALKANYFDAQTLEEFWISRPRADGCDSLYPMRIHIDQDVVEEYWLKIRRLQVNELAESYMSPGNSKQPRGSQERGVRRREMDRRWQPARHNTTATDAEEGGSDESS